MTSETPISNELFANFSCLLAKKILVISSFGIYEPSILKLTNKLNGKETNHIHNRFSYAFETALSTLEVCFVGLWSSQAGFKVLVTTNAPYILSKVYVGNVCQMANWKYDTLFCSISFPAFSYKCNMHFLTSPLSRLPESKENTTQKYSMVFLVSVVSTVHYVFSSVFFTHGGYTVVITESIPRPI